MPDTIYGRSLQEARRVATAKLTSFPVNSTSIIFALQMPVGLGKIRIESVSWVASAVLSDTDGVMTVAVTAYDNSEAADDAIVSATTVEGGTAFIPAFFALATEGTEMEMTLDEGDSLRVIFVNDSAAINTNGAISIDIVYYPVPNYSEKGPGVKHPSAYSA